MKYLKQVRKLSDSSVNHYTQALRRISQILRKHSKISESIYELKDIGELTVVMEYINTVPEYIALNNRGNNMYSAGLNNYFRFASGEDMFGKKDVLKTLDTELPVGEKVKIVHEEWKRSSIIKVQTLETAEYKCEIDSTHKTFTAKNTGKQYMEGHHAIPMKCQSKFSKSIDVYANVICLCPICHRMLHFGEDEIKIKILNQVYEERKDRLAVSGIKIAKNDFIELAI